MFLSLGLYLWTISGRGFWDVFRSDDERSLMLLIFALVVFFPLSYCLVPLFSFSSGQGSHKGGFNLCLVWKWSGCKGDHFRGKK